jgi:hypothetical protein
VGERERGRGREKDREREGGSERGGERESEQRSIEILSRQHWIDQQVLARTQNCSRQQTAGAKHLYFPKMALKK